MYSDVYIVERTNKAEIRPEEQSEKVESCGNDKSGVASSRWSMNSCIMIDFGLNGRNLGYLWALSRGDPH